MEDYSLLTFPLWILFLWLKNPPFSISPFSKPDVKCNWLRPIFRSSSSFLLLLPKKDQPSRRNSINDKTKRMKQERNGVSTTCTRSDSSTGPVIRTMFAETWIFYKGLFLKRAHTDSSNSKKDTYTRDLLFSTVLDLRHFSTIHPFLPSIDRLFSRFFFLFSFPLSLSLFWIFQSELIPVDSI